MPFGVLTFAVKKPSFFDENRKIARENIFIVILICENVHRIKVFVNMAPEISEIVYKALKVESGREIPRTKVEMKVKDGFEMVIYGEDVHALRAAINSYLRWLNLAVNVAEVIEDGNKFNPDVTAEG